MNPIAIAIHGGAGTILRALLTEEKERAYYQALQDAVEKGHQILAKGGSALKAVEETVRELEDCILFNAGRGSVFTHQGEHELDAAIMCGATGMAGAVAGVRRVRNPITLAKAVMQHSEHVLLTGEGAENFGHQVGVAFEPEEYFFDAFRYEQWQAAKAEDSIKLDHSAPILPDKKLGTVGAVALDAAGNLAAATSTGGMTNKKFNRVGDTPIIGAGTYANNATCAVSCTGHGEYFMRAVVAYDVSCLVEYKGLTITEACLYVVQEKLKKQGGEGGLIALNTKGEIALTFNSEGMYRASKRNDEPTYVGIYE
ncbi:isoaspartyl peptidase/L-asparaginase family protein [Adhaeribacter radiodurans]|uniref:Isoaspartyl peptidase n=1 Tax=Adhaeribacter radiodurans TaxID=2745197 RepID=A0A7L7L6K0_9BACT|nr:isoaspartyl peptidase/L-asparaginase [Adhaeribacter radiodurans]QMU28461.1 isoaspartyl peptidase/L-asparaginase [Adhaeribacter radiodurans]